MAGCSWLFPSLCPFLPPTPTHTPSLNSILFSMWRPFPSLHLPLFSHLIALPPPFYFSLSLFLSSFISIPFSACRAWAQLWPYLVSAARVTAPLSQVNIFPRLWPSSFLLIKWSYWKSKILKSWTGLTVNTFTCSWSRVLTTLWNFRIHEWCLIFAKHKESSTKTSLGF